MANANPPAVIAPEDLVQWERVRDAVQSGRKILIANAYGTDVTQPSLEASLGVALALRGASVHFLLCDGVLPACWVPETKYVSPEQFAQHGPAQHLCQRCVSGTHGVFSTLGLPIHTYGSLLSESDLKRARELSLSTPAEEIKDFHLDRLSIGEHAYSGALRYFARGDLKGEVHGETILRRYFSAALQTAFAVRRLFDRQAFDAVVMLHGIYVPEGIIGEVAQEKGVRIVDWSFSYRKQTFIFSHGDTYHRTMRTESSSVWDSMKWSSEMESEILDYLESRRNGSRDWVKFVENPQENIATIADELRIDFSKPTIGLLTNVIWDAQVCYKDTAFRNMLEWVLETIRYFEKRSDLQLLVRVHPAELVGVPPSRQPLIDEILRVFPVIPSNVFIVPPESSISTYVLMSECNAVLIYGTKTGVELAAFGIPVIVAGEAWIRDKGITLDASCPDEYFQLLERLPLDGRLDAETTRRARMYAYHFFFRRMVPLPFMSSTEQLSINAPGARTNKSRLEDLAAGRHVGLDVVCSGILTGSEFIFPAEDQRFVPVEAAEKTTQAHAGWNLRTLTVLAEIGELARMRAHLMKTIQQFPMVLEDSTARSVIPSNVCRLALASISPVSEIRSLQSEMIATVSRDPKLRNRSVRRLQADMWRELSIGLWKSGSYRQAAIAAAHALRYDPAQVLQKTLWKRFAQALFVQGASADYVGS